MERLKRRRDFLAVASGARTGRPAFVLQTLERADEAPARLGLTVTKRTAQKAVERNRIRRRLREAARLAAGGAGMPGSIVDGTTGARGSTVGAPGTEGAPGAAAGACAPVTVPGTASATFSCSAA